MRSFRNNLPISIFVIPAQAGTQHSTDNWFPACAGMTKISPHTEFVKSFLSGSLAAVDEQDSAHRQHATGNEWRCNGLGEQQDAADRAHRVL